VDRVDRETFDALTRLMATSGSRRAALTALLGVTLAGPAIDAVVKKRGKRKGKGKGKGKKLGKSRKQSRNMERGPENPPGLGALA
jgi:hypothetical protein